MTENTTKMSENAQIVKTNIRGYRNLLTDIAMQYDRLACGPFAGEEMKKNYPLSYCFCLCHNWAKEGGLATVEDVKCVKGQMSSFTLRLNVPNADITLRINRLGATLYLGGRYAYHMSCANSAYTAILDELYNRADHVGVAA